LVLGSESKLFVTCPHIWSLKWDRNPELFNAGDLFIVTDHANISASSPGIGPNMNEYGPRFFDISGMYDTRIIEAMREHINKE